MQTKLLYNIHLSVLKKLNVLGDCQCFYKGNIVFALLCVWWHGKIFETNFMVTTNEQLNTHEANICLKPNKRSRRASKMSCKNMMTFNNNN